MLQVAPAVARAAAAWRPTGVVLPQLLAFPVAEFPGTPTTGSFRAARRRFLSPAFFGCRFFHANPPSSAAEAVAVAEEQGPLELRLTNLPFNVSVKALREFYRSFGPVANVQLAKRAQDGLPLGWAVVTFQKAKDAQKALEATEGKTLGTRPISAALSQLGEGGAPLPEGDTERVVYVGNLDHTCNPDQLRSYYAVYGSITDVLVRTKRENDKWETYALLRFATVEQAQRASQAINNSTGNSTAVNSENTAECTALTASASPVVDIQTDVLDVCVKFLPRKVTSVGIGRFFQKFGDVTRVYLPRYRSTNMPKEHAFVSFRTIQGARNAAKKANGAYFGGRTLTVTLSESQVSEKRQCPVFVRVSNVPFQAAPVEVTEVLEQFGVIERMYFPRNEVGNVIGCAMVTFKNLADARRAVAKGKTLQIRGNLLQLELQTQSPFSLPSQPLPSNSLLVSPPAAIE